MKKILKRFWTSDSGQAIYCTTNEATKSVISNDAVVDIKTTRKNLIDAILSIDPDFYQIDMKKYPLSDLIKIANNHNLLFEKF